MPIAEDASSPAAVVGAGSGTTLTTASFSPPAGALLVALVCGETSTVGTAMSVTLTDSSAATWTPMVWGRGSDAGGMVAVQIAYLTEAPGPITVTATFTGLKAGRMLNVRVLTGADAQQSASQGRAAAFSKVFSSLLTGSLEYVPTVANSLVLGISNCPTRANNATGWAGTSIIISQHSNLADGAQAVTWRAPTGTSTAQRISGVVWAAAAPGNVALFEVMPEGTFPDAPPVTSFVDGMVVKAGDLQNIATNIRQLHGYTQGGIRYAPYRAGGKGPTKPLAVLSWVKPEVTAASGTWVQMPWDTQVADSENGWSTISRSNYYFWTGGLWRLHLQVQFLGLTTLPQIEAAILLNGSAYPANAVASVNLSGTAVGCGVTLQIPAESVATCQAIQYSGAAATFGLCQFTAEWLGP